MSKYKFKITYRNENKYGQYWGDNRYTVSIIAETIEQAKQKLDEIEKNDYGMHKNILTWEAEEILEEKDKEIKRLKEEYVILQNASDEVEEELQQRIDKALSYLRDIGNWLRDDSSYRAKLIDILQGSDKE